MTNKTLVDRMAVILNRDGPTNFVKRVVSFGYNRTLRPYLPQTGVSVVKYNDVAVIDDEGRLGDSLPLAGDIPLYEQPIIRGVREYIVEGDTVVVVGAGWGVVTTIVVRQIGDEGHCFSYEGSEKMYERAARTLKLNGVDDEVTLRHAIVAQNIDVWGNEGDADVLPTDELQRCDALILDCEGIEHRILTELEFDPGVVIVEAHGSCDGVTTKLRDRGYEIVDEELYLPSEDTYVLTAIK